MFIMTGATTIIGDDISSAEGTGFSVTDGNGKTFDFDAPVNRVITFGYATTLTVVQAAGVDKVIACDKYSQYNYYKDDRLKNLNAVDFGSPFIKDGTALEASIVQLANEGKFDKEKDAILTTNSSSINTLLYPLLKDDGFKNLLFWGTFDDYSGLVDCVGSIATVVGGANNPIKKTADETYANAKANVPTERVNFIYLWYSASNGHGIGADNALGSSMITAAGGKNIASGITPTSGAFAYNGINQVIQYLENNPKSVIFLADNYVDTKSGETVEQAKERFIQNELSGNTMYPVYIMEKNWNNYCLDSINGLTTVNEYLRSVEFTDEDTSNGLNVVSVISIAAVAITAIAVVVFFVVKRKI